MKRLCRPREHGVSFSEATGPESNRAEPSHAAFHSTLILHTSVPMTNVEDRSVHAMDLCQPMRIGTCRLDHQRRCSAAMPTAGPPSRDKTKVHLAHGSIPSLQGSPSEKSGTIACRCRRISLASSRVLAQERSRQIASSTSIACVS